MGQDRREADPRRAVEAFHDGGCPLCRAEIAAYRAMAGGESVAWRDAAAGEAPPEVDAAAALARFHARRADGRLVSGFAAFVAIWRALPRLAWAGRLVDRPPFLQIGEAGYRVFLRLRPLWRRRAADPRDERPGAGGPRRA